MINFKRIIDNTVILEFFILQNYLVLVYKLSTESIGF